LNRFRWQQKWKNMYAHQRAEILKLLGVTSKEGIQLLVNKKFTELHPSTQLAMKHLNREDIL